MLVADEPSRSAAGSGTEAVNLAIKGTVWANERRGRHIVLSAVEHPAIAQSVKWLCEHGFSSSVVPVDPEGRIDLDAIKAAVREDTILVCTHHANHDIGTIQQVRAIGDFTSERGIPLFVDAIASAGWLALNVEELRADLVAVSPHRFYGPKGVGLLYRHRRARVQSLVHGGEQEDGRRAGTENISAIVGAGIVGSACAATLSASGLRVLVLESNGIATGTTAAGMSATASSVFSSSSTSTAIALRASSPSTITSARRR